MSEKRGVLYLVPNLLDPSSSPEATLPAAAIAKVRELRRFVVEGDKAAWRLLSRILEPEEAKAVAMERLDEHTRAEDIPSLLSPLESGEDIGLISEAGMPCVADPGAALAALAHDRGFRVVPLVGPSSILLALAASGLDGQRFSFLGYLPPDPSGRKSALASMDRSIKADGATRIFIETPYRNDRLLDDCLGVLSGGTRLCVAASLLSAEEIVISKSVASWKAGPRAVIGKVPAIFLAGMSARAGAGASSGAGETRGKGRGLDLGAGRRHS